MAFLEELKITGSLGDLSFYYMQGVDKIVVRRKGGASRDHIRNAPAFATPRLYMSEFGGCSKMGKEVRFMLHPMKAMADYNFSGFVNKALKAVQKLDGISELGRRSIALSKYPSLLTGFSLNKYTTFDSIVRSPVRYTIDRGKRSAQVNVPRLLRDINFFPNNKHTRFRIVVCLGIVPDFEFNPVKGRYEPPAWYNSRYDAQTVHSPWYAALKGSPEATLNVACDQIPPDASYSVMLTVGVQFGSPMEDDVVAPVKRAGAAKILGIAGIDGVAIDASLLPAVDAAHKEPDTPGSSAHAVPEKESAGDSKKAVVANSYCVNYVSAPANAITRVYTYVVAAPASPAMESSDTGDAGCETAESSSLSGHGGIGDERQEKNTDYKMSYEPHPEFCGPGTSKLFESGNNSADAYTT